MNQKTIAEKLRECAKMLLEVADEIQLSADASVPHAREGGKGRSAELRQTAETDYDKAVAVIRETRRASISYFHRKLGWGYNHTCAVLDRLEEDGLIGPGTDGRREIFWDKFPMG